MSIGTESVDIMQNVQEDISGQLDELSSREDNSASQILDATVQINNSVTEGGLATSAANNENTLEQGAARNARAG